MNICQKLVSPICIKASSDSNQSEISSSTISSLRLFKFFEKYIFSTLLNQPKGDLINKEQIVNLLRVYKKESKSHKMKDFSKFLCCKSILFHEDIISSIFYSICKNSNSINKTSFWNFYEDADQKSEFQRIFYILSEGSEFVIYKKGFEEKLTQFCKIFGKILKNFKNLIILYLFNLREEEKNEENYVYYSYMKLISDFKDSSQVSLITKFFFEDSQEKIDKKIFLKKILNYRRFPLVHLFEYMKLEKRVLTELLDKNVEKFETLNFQSNEKNGQIIKQIKKVLNRCEYNGDPACSCTTCRM